MSIHEKIIKFQKRFKGADKTGWNPHFKSNYYTADDLRGAVKPILDELGLYISHQLDPVDGGMVVWTYITDENGENISSGFPVPPCNNPQVAGSWLTYGQRYNIMGLLFSGGELEDDGNIAAANAPDMVSDETAATINDYLEANGLSPEQKAFFAAHPVESMTEDQAQSVLKRLKAAA